MYPGPLRPDNQIAIVERQDIQLLAIDRDPVQGVRYALLPGDHALLLKPPERFSASGQPGALMRICVTTLPGHVYLVRWSGQQADWRPEVVDRASQQPVAARPIDPSFKRCPTRSYLTASSPPEAGAVAPPGDLLPRATAIDDETPYRPAPVATVGASGRLVDHPGTAFGLVSGIALGGDKIATAMFADGHSDNIRAGEGVVLDLQLSFTPLWIGDSFGFGAGGSIGVKHSSIDASNGSISLTRFPAVAFAQMMSPIGERGSLLLRAGVVKDLGVNLGLEVSGQNASGDLPSQMGFMAEIGAWYHFARQGATLWTVRYTRETYGDGVDASSGTFLVGIFFDPR